MVVWGISEQLLAIVADALHVANWQRSNGKRSAKPKPIQRPGVDGSPEKRFGKPQPISRIRARLRQLNGR